MVLDKWRDGEFCRRYPPVHGVHAEDAGVDVVNPVAADIKIRRIVRTEVNAVHNLRSVGFARYGYVGGMSRSAGLVFLLLVTDTCNLSLPVLQ